MADFHKVGDVKKFTIKRRTILKDNTQGGKKSEISKRQKLRYDTDTEYRERIKERYRNRYYEISSNRTFINRITVTLEELDQYGKVDKVITDGGDIIMVNVFSKNSLSRLLDLTSSTIIKMVREGMIPAPILTRYSVNNKRYSKVYHIKEIEGFLVVFNEHYCRKRYYTKKDTYTRDLLFDKCLEVRKKYKLL